MAAAAAVVKGRQRAPGRCSSRSSRQNTKVVAAEEDASGAAEADVCEDVVGGGVGARVDIVGSGGGGGDSAITSHVRLAGELELACRCLTDVVRVTAGVVVTIGEVLGIV